MLVAQFGAEAHAYSHLAKDPDGATNSSQYCAKCLSFAPVTIAAGGMPHVALILGPETEPAVATAAASILALSPRPAFQPRAPPTFL